MILKTRMQETFWVDTASYCASLLRNLSLIADYALNSQSQTLLTQFGLYVFRLSLILRARLKGMY